MRLALLATESGIPADSLLTQSAVPLGILIFLGFPFMLLRSNLGTRRAYLVLTTSFFGFMILISAFWAFGAPGTPATTGPTNLPGQVPDEYQPIWVPFAEDSEIAADPVYAAVVGNDEAFTPVEVGEDVAEGDEAEEDEGESLGEGPNAVTGVSDIQNFFSQPTEESGYPQRIQASWIPTDVGLAEAENGRPVVRATFVETYEADPEGNLPEDAPEGAEVGDPVEGGDSFVAYAFFDAGNPVFPSLVFIGLSLLGFALHAVLLFFDEQGERRERTQATTAVEQRVPVKV
jgi:hypothetical protein